MSDPSDYVGWEEYLGLNREAGESMLAPTMAEGETIRTDALGAVQRRRDAARGAGMGEVGGEEEYARAGEQARQGVASYGEFMQAMVDPASRRALMEKTYGKGRVSWLDSATAGGAGAERIAVGGVDARRLAQTEEEAGWKAEDRKSGYARQAAMDTKEKARGTEQRQVAFDARQKLLAEREQADVDREWEESGYGAWGSGAESSWGANPRNEMPDSRARIPDKWSTDARYRRSKGMRFTRGTGWL